MTSNQRDALIALIHEGHNEHNSPYSDVRDAVEDMVGILTSALEQMQCTDDNE